LRGLRLVGGRQSMQSACGCRSDRVWNVMPQRVQTRSVARSSRYGTDRAKIVMCAMT